MEIQVSIWNSWVLVHTCWVSFASQKQAKDFVAGNNVIILAGALTYSLYKTTQVWTRERRTRSWQCQKTYNLTPRKVILNQPFISTYKYIYIYIVHHTQLRETRQWKPTCKKIRHVRFPKIQVQNWHVKFWINCNSVNGGRSFFFCKGVYSSSNRKDGMQHRAPAITPIWACARQLPVSIWPRPMRTGCA